MDERRRHPRFRPPVGERLLTLHGSCGNITGRAEDISHSGIGVRVRQAEGLAVGQMVLVHRMHEQNVRMGVVRYLGDPDESGYRVGIELHPDCTITPLFPPKGN